MTDRTTEAALLRPSEVMRRLAVSRDSLMRWEEAGHLTPVRLPSGTRRYRSGDVEAIERGDVPAPAPVSP